MYGSALQRVKASGIGSRDSGVGTHPQVSCETGTSQKRDTQYSVLLTHSRRAGQQRTSQHRCATFCSTLDFRPLAAPSCSGNCCVVCAVLVTAADQLPASATPSTAAALHEACSCAAMGKSAAGKGHQRANSRRSVKSAASTATTRSRPSHATDTADIDDFLVDAQQQRAQQLAEHVSHAEELVGRAHYTEATQLLAALLSSHPTVAALHDLLALAAVGLGDTDGALQHIVAACQLDAHGSGDRWMYKGQLSHGREAMEAFERGAAVYRRQKDDLQARQQQQNAAHSDDKEEREDEEEEEEATAEGRLGRLAALRQCLSTAYVSMAELYVTDCCDESEAEQRCESLLAGAMDEWPNNADGAYATANLRLIQGDQQQAAHWLDRTVAILEHSSDDIRLPALSLLAAATSGSSCPLSSGAAASYELRLNVAKLAYELGRHSQCARLLDALLDEDDQFIEVQHLAALAHMHCQRFYTATQHATTAVGMCKANGAQDRRVQRQLQPVVAALQQIIAQCDGKEDAAPLDDDDDQAGEVDGEDEAAEADDMDDQADDGGTEGQMEQQSGHERMSLID